MHAPAPERSDAAVFPQPLRYRQDIDGLRAVAVLAVVGFHAFPGVIRSGFVGVDIFFVISGYLITSIILREGAAHRFSFARFYARRIRRIFPALITVLVACLAIGAVLQWPADYALLGKHTAAGAGFVANLALWQESNYFDVASDSKVLLHLWSLGVEEQFYIVWPAVLWLTFRTGLRRWLIFSIFFAASFAYGIKTITVDPVAAFYSPVGRFWELMIGSTLALIVTTQPRPIAWFERSTAWLLNKILIEPDHGQDADTTYRNMLSLLGMAMIATSLFVITKRTEFPGWAALLPVIGAYLTIAAGPDAWLNRAVLSNKAAIWVGMISYPLYLWHWPLLAFARYLNDDETAPLYVRTALMVAAIGLAWVTYEFIERPLRFSKNKRVTRGLILAGVAVGLCGVMVAATKGVPARLSADKRDYVDYFSSAAPLIRAEAKDIGQNQCNFYWWNAKVPTLAPRPGIDPSCYTRHSAKAVMVLGDSNASDLYYGLDKELPKEVSLLLIYSSGCQISPIIEWIIKTHHCTMANYFALERIKADPPDVLLLSSNNSYDIGYIRAFSAKVKSYGVKHVIVLGMRPHWKKFLYRTVLDHYWHDTPRYIPGHLDTEAMSLTWHFQAQLQADEPFEFVDETKNFCNEDGCLAYLGDNRRDGLITADTVHLRPFASDWHAKQHLVPLIMRDLAPE